jgi:sialate O-acetylesterase
LAPLQGIALAAKYPQIRLFTVGQSTISPTPLATFATIEQQWSVASPASVGNGQWSFFSATCWFFGREMADKLRVPIGLVSTNWGGTYVQAWSSPDALSKCKGASEENKNTRVAFDGPNPNQPSVLWNAMVVPLLPMRITAVAWYQAEANVSPQGDLAYICQFPAMIQDWSAKMNSKSFHFYFVQLAPYWTDDHTSLAGMRLAQEAALLLPYVGMATAVDLGDPTSDVGVIHPRDKQTVGLRLARAALNLSYGNPVSWLGPQAVKAVYVAR